MQPGLESTCKQTQGTVSPARSKARGMRIIAIHFYPEIKVWLLMAGDLGFNFEFSFWLCGLQQVIQLFQDSFLDKISKIQDWEESVK